MNKTNKHIVLISAAGLVIMWIYTIVKYFSLPDEIVGHMNFNGEVTRYDDKNVIWFLVILFTGVFYGVYKLSKNELNTNYNRFQDKDKAQTISLLVLPYLSIISLAVVYTVIKKSEDLAFNTNWLMYCIIGFTIIYLLVMFTLSFKYSKK